MRTKRSQLILGKCDRSPIARRAELRNTKLYMASHIQRTPITCILDLAFGVRAGTRQRDMGAGRAGMIQRAEVHKEITLLVQL